MTCLVRALALAMALSVTFAPNAQAARVIVGQASGRVGAAAGAAGAVPALDVNSIAASLAVANLGRGLAPLTFPHATLRAGAVVAPALTPGAISAVIPAVVPVAVQAPATVRQKIAAIKQTLRASVARPVAEMSAAEGYAAGIGLEKALTGEISVDEAGGDFAPQASGQWVRSGLAAGGGEEAGKISKMTAEERYAAAAQLKAPAAPRILRARARGGLYWGGLTAAAALPHIINPQPFLLGLALFLSVSATVMVRVFAGHDQVAAAPANEAVVSDKPAAQVLRDITALAASLGVPAPQRVQVDKSAETNAFVVGMRRSDWTLRVTEGFLELPAVEREAILRHELGHVTHRDNLASMAMYWLAPAAPMLALLAGAQTDSSLLFLAVLVGSVLGFFHSSRAQEYLADQFSAHSQGDAKPLAAWMIGAAPDNARTAQSLSGTAFAEESGFKRSLLTAWAWLRQTFKLHPSWELRLARLARLSR